jgi:ketosteroid isomerase-like protein
MAEESTTPDVAELTRQQLDAWNRRDFDAAMSFYAHDAVFTSHGIGAFEGRTAIRGFNEDWLASFEAMTGSSRRSATSAAESRSP